MALVEWRKVTTSNLSNAGKYMGRAITATKAAIIACCICCGFLWAPAVNAQGDPPPDTLDIESACVATGLAETGDWLIAVQYDVGWELEANYPDEPINEKFIVQMLDHPGSSSYAATTPYVFWNNGYDKGVVALYFSALEATALNLQWEEQYIIRIITQPGAFTSEDDYQYYIPTNEYCTSGTASQAANRNWLATYVLNTAKTLELDWGVSTALTTISLNEVLSEYGELYYTRVIRGLRDLCPELFMATDTIPDFTETVYTGSHAGALESQWDGQDNFVTDGTEALGDLLGGNSTFATNLIILAIGMAVIMLSGATLRSIGPGLLACTTIVMMIGVDLGFLEFSIYAIVLFLMAAYSINKVVRINQA